MTEKGTEPRKVLTWGKGETEKHVPLPKIVLGWICVFFIYIYSIPFFSALAVWVLLALIISLVREENKTARINGWVLLPLFALKLLAILVQTFGGR